MEKFSFSVTWDYLCPFARNAHEHVVAALDDGAPWEVEFTPFSLVQNHVEEGGDPVWDAPEEAKGVLALQAGVVVRDRFPDRFGPAHVALFAVRHDEEATPPTRPSSGRPSRPAGSTPTAVFAEIAEGWPLKVLRRSPRGVSW